MEKWKLLIELDGNVKNEKHNISNHVSVIGISKEEMERKENMSDNFPELLKDNNPQIQKFREAQTG